MALKKKTQKKIVIVTRETRIDDLRKRFTSVDQLSFYVKSRGGNVQDYVAEDRIYKSSLSVAEKELDEWGHLQFVDRDFLPNFVFGPEDTVIAIGQDGLVANTLKYLRDNQPLIGVNPDPERWDGVLLPFRIEEVEEIIEEVLAGRYRSRSVTMAEAQLNDGQTLLGVNDLFIGQRTHTSARYMIESHGASERHSSSGVIVSTGLGSTGWLKSLAHGATRISEELGLPAGMPRDMALPWDTEKFYFTVREPFPSVHTQADLVFGEVTPSSPLKIRSLMPENGVIFSDGIESDFVEFNSGAEAAIGISKTRGNLVLR